MSSRRRCARRAASATASTASTSRRRKDGVFVIEVNDNPNLDHGCEDSGEKDEVWVRLTQWFLDRLERQGR